MTELIRSILAKKNSWRWGAWLIVIVSIIVSIEAVSIYFVPEEQAIEIFDTNQHENDSEEQETKTEKETEKNISNIVYLSNLNLLDELRTIPGRFWGITDNLLSIVTPPPEQYLSITC